MAEKKRMATVPSTVYPGMPVAESTRPPLAVKSKQPLIVVHKVNTQEVMLFCRQMATFVRVGIPITTAIRTFASEAGSKPLRDACTDMALEIEGGALLSEAIAQHPRVFPGLVADMVRAAEVTGNLDKVLRQAAIHIERETSARQKIRAAMIYPLVVAAFALLIVSGIVAFVLPEFRDLYKGLGVPLPGLVVFMLSVSNWIGTNGLALALALTLLIGFLVFSQRTVWGRNARGTIALRIPLVGALLRTAIAERFCRTLGDMLGSGVPITQAFPVVVNATRNAVYQRQLHGVAVAMAMGEGFARPLRKTGLFKPMLTQMMTVGEETGSLDLQLNECADLHAEELDYRIKRMTSVVEPALIVGVGVIVGFVEITMVTAIYSIAGGFK